MWPCNTSLMARDWQMTSKE